MLVSVTVPTWSREDRLPALHAQFAAQTYPGPLELVVLDDSPAPSAYFTGLRDARVRYHHAPARATTGGKRDRLLHLARGEIHLQWDDDDRYAPDYVARTVDHLGDHDFFTYDVWHLVREADGSVWRWDTRRLDDVHYVIEGPAGPVRRLGLHDHLQSEARRAAWLHRNRWGFGWKYAYRAEPARAAGVPDLAAASDYAFVERLIARGARLHSAPDLDGVGVHVVQPTSTSRCFPQARVPDDRAARLRALAASGPG